MRRRLYLSYAYFFFNDTATTEIYTLSLHDALPISCLERQGRASRPGRVSLRYDQRGLCDCRGFASAVARRCGVFYRLRSEEHTSELQSRLHLVCRLLLEKKKSICHLNNLPHAYSHA